MTFDQRILSNIPYIASNDDDICTDLQTLYNTVYSLENAYGSSDRYTVPPFLDNVYRTNRKKEYYESMGKCNKRNYDSLDFANYMFPIICIVMMIIAITILIHRGKLN
jgi:hypothetical protein